jgi:molybdate transport system substrate-binding protein
MHTANPHRRSVMRALTFGVALSIGSLYGLAAQAKDVTIFAAASLKNALDDVAAAWSSETGKKTVISYAASNVLAKQIEAGAPADIFFSADLDWMDYAASKNMIDDKSRVQLLSNSLVLVALRDANFSVSLQPGIDLASSLGSGRLAMGNVDAVPAGKYGKAALENLRAWDGVKDKVAQAENVRAALLLVSRGEAPLGIVYKTDAVSDSNVKIVASFPPESHAPIVYPVALTKDSTNIDAAEFLAFLRSAKAKPFFEKQGFGFMDKPGSNS